MSMFLIVLHLANISFRHTFGPVLWRGELTKAELIGIG